MSAFDSDCFPDSAGGGARVPWVAEDGPAHEDPMPCQADPDKDPPKHTGGAAFAPYGSVGASAEAGDDPTDDVDGDCDLLDALLAAAKFTQEHGIDPTTLADGPVDGSGGSKDGKGTDDGTSGGTGSDGGSTTGGSGGGTGGGGGDGGTGTDPARRLENILELARLIDIEQRMRNDDLDELKKHERPIKKYDDRGHWLEEEIDRTEDDREEPEGFGPIEGGFPLEASGRDRGSEEMRCPAMVMPRVVPRRVDRDTRPPPEIPGPENA